MNRNELILKNERLQTEFNNTTVAYNRDLFFHQLFEQQAKKQPQKVALFYKNQYITYKELNNRANQIAYKLKQLGVESNIVVSLISDRSIDMFAGILGILKSGGCYLPIDPTLPTERIRYMIENSGSKLVLFSKSVDKKIDCNTNVLMIDEIHQNKNKVEDLENSSTSDDLAYVIYTSGTTGNPKGVMIEHGMILNFIKGVTGKIEFLQDYTMLCLTSISFDIFALESLIPLSLGMRIIIANPMNMWKYVDDESVDMMQTTPSTMKLILGDKKNLKCIERMKIIMLGGEQFPDNLLRDLKKVTNSKIFNMYGPTETTVWSTIKELTNEDKISIGKPIANTEVYVLDENGQAVGIGEEGELYIAGDGVARGYINNEVLTREKFVLNSRLNKRLYKTGDRAKWIEEGELEILGRIDFQVKIRGFRIELGEIESAMEDFHDIRECVAWTYTNQVGDQCIVLYYVSDRDLIISDITKHLKTKLPEYMMPALFVRIGKVPLTNNGKTDRKSLPIPQFNRPNLGEAYLPSSTTIEKQIEAIWRRLLKREVIGVNDNFFDLGGNSLLVSELHLNLEKHFPGRTDISDIFANPTISKLSTLISKDRNSKPESKITGIKLLLKNHIPQIDDQRITSTISLSDNEKIHLESLASSKKYEIQHLLLASYFLVLSGYSIENKLAVLVQKEDKYYDQLIIELDEFKEFDDLATEIKVRLTQNGSISCSSFTSLENEIINIDEVVPIFYKNTSKNTIEVQKGELALLYRDTPNGFSIEFVYQGPLLTEKHMNTLAKNYNGILQALLSDSNSN